MNSLRSDLGNLLKSSYKPQKEAKKDMKKLGYGYDNKLSTMEAKVFVKNGQPTIVHRGSTTYKDIIDDGLLTIGLAKYGHKYKNAQRLTKKVEERYGKPADTVGHSYGGWLAENSNAKGNKITYNKAVGLGDLFKNGHKNQLDVSTSGDLVSGLGITQGGKKEIIDNKSFFSNPLNAHNINNLFPNN